MHYDNQMLIMNSYAVVITLNIRRSMWWIVGTDNDAIDKGNVENDDPENSIRRSIN